MKVLITLFDAQEALNNVLIACALEPERIVFLGEDTEKFRAGRKTLRRFFDLRGRQELQLEFRETSLSDVSRVRETLMDVLDAYGVRNCILDAAGGSALLYMGAGMCCSGTDLRVITFRPGKNDLFWLWGPHKGQTAELSVSVTSEQAAALAGGSVLRHDHLRRGDYDDAFLSRIPTLFSVYFRHKEAWPDFVMFMQQIKRPEYNTQDSLSFRGPCEFRVRSNTAGVSSGILLDLQEAGAISDVSYTLEECSFRAESQLMLKYLCNQGVWLELYLYYCASQIPEFEDVEMSTIIGWDEEAGEHGTTNEIDVIASCGYRQIFISCKTGIPSAPALNEISEVTRHFGGRLAVPVLAAVCDLKTEAPSSLLRAESMGIACIDRDDLEEKALIRRLREIAGLRA